MRAIKKIDGIWRCLICKSPSPNQDEPHVGECQCGLGDIVKAGLSAVGITEERVSKAIGKPCGCGKRAAAMNKFGAKYLGMPSGRMGNLEPDA